LLHTTKIESGTKHKTLASYFFCAVFLAMLVSCNPTKKLLPNQYIVDRVEVLNTRETNLPKENFEAFFRQKPNRKFLRKIDFFVWWYNLFDNEKINRKKIKYFIFCFCTITMLSNRQSWQHKTCSNAYQI